MAPLFVIKWLSGSVSTTAALQYYLGAIRPILLYSAPTWWTDKDAHGSKLNLFQYRLLNRCLGTFHNTRSWVTHALAGVPLLNAHLNMVVELYVSRVPYHFNSHPSRCIVLSILNKPPANPPTILERLVQFVCTHGLPTPEIYSGDSAPPPTTLAPGLPTTSGTPPQFALENYVIPLLEAVALMGMPVLFVGIDHKNTHLKIFPRFMPPDSPYTSTVYTIQMPKHTIGECTHTALLTLIDAPANMPAHLLTPDIVLVILASRHIPCTPTALHIFIINKSHILHLPKKAFYYCPPTYVLASFQDHCQSRWVTTHKIKQLLAQSFAEDVKEHIPQDHIFRTFGLIRDAINTVYPSFIPLQRPASQTATLACLTSGHTFIGSYYKSRNIPDTEVSCPCGMDVQDIPHVFLNCPITVPFKHLLDNDGDLNTLILFTDKLNSLLEWLKATNTFTKQFGLRFRHLINEDTGSVTVGKHETSSKNFHVPHLLTLLLPSPMELSSTPTPAPSGTSASNTPQLISVSTLIKRVAKLNKDVSTHPSSGPVVACVAAELLDLLCETTNLVALRTMILDHQTLGPLLSPAVLPSFYQALQRIEESVSRLHPPHPQLAPPNTRPRNPPPATTPAAPTPPAPAKATPSTTYVQAAQAPAAPELPKRKFNPSPKVASAYRKKKNSPSHHSETLWSPSAPNSFDISTIHSGPAPLTEMNTLLAKCVPPCALKGLQWTDRRMVLLTPTHPEDGDILSVRAADALSQVFGGHSFTQFSYGPLTGIVCYGTARGSPTDHDAADTLNLLCGGLGLSPSDVIPAKSRWLVTKGEEKTAAKPSFLIHLTLNETAKRLLAPNPHFITGVHFSLKSSRKLPPSQTSASAASRWATPPQNVVPSQSSAASVANNTPPLPTRAPSAPCRESPAKLTPPSNTPTAEEIMPSAQPPKKKQGPTKATSAPSYPIATFIRAIPPGSVGYSVKTASLKDAKISQHSPLWCTWNRYPLPTVNASGHVTWTPPTPGPDTNKIKVVNVNVHRGIDHLRLALSLAQDSYNISTGNINTVKNRNWTTVLPINPVPPGVQPRVILFLNKALFPDHRVATKFGTFRSPDMLHATVTILRQKINFFGIYQSLTINHPLQVLQKILEWETPIAESILCGDFNISHPDWDATQTRPHDSTFARWVKDESLTVENDPHVPTRIRQNQDQCDSVIDLFITNPSFKASWDTVFALEIGLGPLADHWATSLTFFPKEGIPHTTQSKTRKTHTDWTKFHTTLCDALHDFGPALQTADPRVISHILTCEMSWALTMASSYLKGKRKDPIPYWSAELTAAHKAIDAASKAYSKLPRQHKDKEARLWDLKDLRNHFKGLFKGA
ncbi:hypothetical protein BOTBODRAFT_174021 [Botryobasidium botryosum FD-172 SS1]|uniref:Endonuclease/exonuclease/phosphatase domain-containing protein n=1 Tax=Botryobasidium botryosum (strain FD-172 SS1) TaxID=930990 RepID=A0A067MTH6_BOTB1|nr:hypothetical protein BOTBODRAFT_174021 [Botryobasidium botryosum FD-172 SS1]